MKINKILLIIFFIIILCMFLGYYFNKELLFLPKGELLYTIDSPNDYYRANIYYVEGGNISADGVRVEVVHNKSKKNIYWSYPETWSETEQWIYDIKWIDSNTININGVTLDVNKQKYRNN